MEEKTDHHHHDKGKKQDEDQGIPTLEQVILPTFAFFFEIIIFYILRNLLVGLRELNILRNSKILLIS